ncbi:trypsin-like peptidase domain-containing protein [Myroides profundi]|uniref:Do/DeqQ family serine protease n=1 Tax=Myroides profundi TaxID=480520 RepID=A0AAJ5BEU6_MYRPR|nr:trypsin-like peptidase domain-containing protein [Myroides profundi]AJH14218.1 serine protease [Myroides profundi]SER29420.1 Do/DeqQ family serine protease [Myroides profundi]
MKKILGVFLICLLSGSMTLVGYKYFFENQNNTELSKLEEMPSAISTTKSSIIPNSSIDFVEAAENTVNTVVHVKNLSYVSSRSNPIMELFYGYKPSPKPQIGTGSGVIITEDGYIVTNNHVIANASELEVTLSNNETYKARLIGTDKEMDIALLKIEPKEKLSYIVFGDSDNIQLGEWVIAVGNPYNLTSTVTAGIVSAKARNLSKTSIQSFIQTDAAINPGNSGGALVNTKGELIGINTMISSNTGAYVGYAFAVPSNVTRKIVEDLLEYGNVQNATLGVSGYELTPQIVKELNISSTSFGFYIQDIITNSGAAQAGLKNGDIITKINNKEIKTFVDLRSIINTKRPKDIVAIEYLRGNDTHSTSITLGKNEPRKIEFRGLELQELDTAEKEELNISYGFKITKILDKDFAKYEDDLIGSILLSINDLKVSNINQIKNIASQINQNQKIKLTLMNKNGEYLRLLI